VRDEIVDLIIGQISLLLPCVDQLFNIVVLVVKSQDGLSSNRPRMEGQSKLVSGGNVDGRNYARAQTFR
jgi:hypothetical protein